MIRVLVVDDHPIVREGLVTVLEDEPDFQVVGSVGSAEEALSFAEREPPDVVLLDLELPGLGGIEAIPRLLAVAPNRQQPRVIVFSAYDADDRVINAIRAGAAGYLLKGATADEIARAIRAVQAGGSYLEPRVASKLIGELNAPAGARSVLSRRELEVLRLVAQGLANKQIARSLGISERTVKFHVGSILTKLDAENRAQAVALATQRGLL